MGLSLLSSLWFEAGGRALVLGGGAANLGVYECLDVHAFASCLFTCSSPHMRYESIIGVYQWRDVGAQGTETFETRGPLEGTPTYHSDFWQAAAAHFKSRRTSRTAWYRLK